MAQENSSRKNLLLISDAISAPTGLARITRDLAVRIDKHLGDVYRLAVAGNGSPGSCKFPFPQYNLQSLDNNWVIPSLPEIVSDFAGNEKCQIMWIWDLSRLSWLAQPDRLGAESLAKYPGLSEWIKTANIEKWCYCPIDASGPNNRLTFPLALTALGFDRLLAYGPFGESVLRASIGDEESDKRHLTNLPHGIDSSIFYEHSHKLSRKRFLTCTGALTMLAMLNVNPEVKPIEDDEVLVGIVATNQSRKNWALALEACAILGRRRKLRVWAHADSLERYWSIPSLLVDYGLLDRTLISLGQISDENMAIAYSALDLFFGIGPEGFGFPCAESLSCGVPCITGAYAGAADFVPPTMQVQTMRDAGGKDAFYHEGSYAASKPVYSANNWADKAEEWIGKRVEFDSRYSWENLWQNEWQPWFREIAK